ncbi:hypothetical protein KKHLCK_09395 [Candidatus Electrothrix laxa]
MPPAIDEFEDLTQFADESFDNDEVDLFEFTDDEESPLLRLKSIVLSLDWDITEDTLAELTEELSGLRSLWDGDKVAQIYLQGMDNIGKYLQKEGAYAHPNAIKLLLTLFYNYEKIISSTDLSSEAIAAMLKADVRKFKVLQYQIGTTGAEEHVEEYVEEHVEEHVEAAQPAPEEIIQEDMEIPPVSHEKTDDPLTSMEATILGLEWEVTQEGLEKFHGESKRLREYLTGNRDAQILVQGLQALGAYIREEKTNAHPDAFTILHAFYDALKLLIKDTNLTADQRKQVLIEQIGSLNSLKSIIAKSAEERAADKSPEEEKRGTETVEAAEISAPEQELEDESESEFDSPVTDDDEDLDLFSEDFDESSDFFLDGDDNLSDDALIDEESIAGDFGFDEEENGLDDDLFADETKEGALDFSLDEDNAEEETVLPALTDADEDGGFNEELVADGIDEEKAAELDEKLDSFFDFDSLDETAEQEEKDVAVEGSDSPAYEQPSAEVEEGDSDLGESEVELDSFFDFSDEEDPKEDERAESWKDEILAADIVEPEGEEEGLLEGEEDYDSFFNFDSDENEDEVLSDERTAVVADADDGALAASNDEFDISLDGLDDEQDNEEIAVALANVDEEGGFNEDEISSGIGDEKAVELDEKLNFFFELDKDEQEGSSGDQIPGAEEGQSATTGSLAEPDLFDEEQDELSLELDEESPELSFDDEKDFEDDFDGDIAGFSDIDAVETVSATADQGDKSASDLEEEIEGFDAIFDLDDDVEGAPEFDKSSAGGPEEIPALDDEFVVSLDDEEEGMDELFDFSSDSDEEGKSSFSIGLDGNIESEENFFGLEEDADKEKKVAPVVADSSAEGVDDIGLEDGANKEDLGADELSGFSFDSDDEGESTVSSESVSVLDSADSLFGLNEKAGGKVEDAEVIAASDSEEDEFAWLLDDEDTKEDDFALSLDDEGPDDDELSDFSFASDDADESAFASESVSDVDPEDSFFGMDEEGEGKVEAAAVSNEDDSEDEFTLSLDVEDTDKLSDFSFGSDEKDEGIAVSDSALELEPDDSFFGLDEESEVEVESTEVADLIDSEDEFVLSLDDEEVEEDEFLLSSDAEDADESVAASESVSDVDPEDSFFGMDEEGEDKVEAAAVSNEDDSEDEFTLSLDVEDTDKLSDFSFGSDEKDEGIAVSDSALELEPDDSFFGLDEESEVEVESTEVADLIDSEDEFVLSLDDEEVEEDEFLLSSDAEDADESVAASESVSDVDPEDSFFGMDEEGEDKVEAAAVSNEDDSEDEFTLSLDVEDTDKLSDFSFGSDEKDEGIAVSDSALELEPDDSFFGLDEESEVEVESTEVADLIDSEDEFVLSFDDEDDEEDEFALSLDDDGPDADELSDFSFASDDVDESAVVSEPVSEVGSEDSFFGMDEETDGEIDSAEGAVVSDAEDEFALSLDDEDAEEDEFALSLDDDGPDADELSDFSFASDDAAESAVTSEPVSEVGSEDSFFGMDEETDGEIDSAEGAVVSDAEDEFALSLDDEDAEEDEFALSLDDDGPDADELSDFSFASDDAAESAVTSEPVSEVGSEDSFFGMNEETDGEIDLAEGAVVSDSEDEFALSLDAEDAKEDEFALSLDDEGPDADELSDFSFASDDADESAVTSEPVSEEVGSEDSFFGMDEETDGEIDLAEGAVVSDAEDEFALSLDDEDVEEDEFALSLDDEGPDADELSDFSFASDDADESAVTSEPVSEVDSEDSFFGMDEETDGEIDLAEGAVVSDSEDEFALSLDDEDAKEDEFALSLDDEGPDADELSDFSFASDDADESAVTSEPVSEEVGSEDSFFGMDEETDGEIDLAEGAVVSDAEDEFALSLDDEDVEEDEFALSLDDEGPDADELSDFSFASDDADESAVTSEPVSEVDSEDSFFGMDEETDGEIDLAEGAVVSDSEDEFALSLDDEDAEEDEFALSLDDEESEELVLTFDDEEAQEGRELSIEDSEDEEDVVLSLDAELLETEEQETEIATLALGIGSVAGITTVAGAAIKAISDDDSELLLDQAFEQDHDIEGQRKNELLLTEDVVEASSEKILSEDADFFLGGDEEKLLRDDEEPDSLEVNDREDVTPLFDVAPFVAAAATVSSAPTLDNIRAVNVLAEAAKRSEGTPQQIVILDLLKAATALIGQQSELDTDDQVVVQELAAGLELAADDPFELTALVHHYTAWQQDFFGRVMAHKEEQSVQHGTPLPPVISDSISNQDAVHQVQEGFSQLREAMKEEFNHLRKELQKG